MKSTPINTENKTGKPESVGSKTRKPAKADFRDLWRSSLCGIEFKVERQSVEAARKEWGITPALALEVYTRARLADMDRRLRRLEDGAIHAAFRRAA